jgi:PAS domain S-box-containing protein
VVGVVACLRDITDERRARDAVAQSESRYRNLFESASDAIYTLDVRGAFTSANDATCVISGFARDELLGRSTAALMDPDEVARVKEEFRAALAGASRRYECALIRRDGERRLLSVTNTPIRQRDRIIGVLGVARDVTEERLSAAALERSEARYTRLVESASDAIFTADASGRFTSVNRALEMSVGVAREALVGAPFTDVVDARDREPMWRLFEETMAGQRTRGEFRYRGADGQTRTGWAITAPIVEQGIVAGALAVVRDVTEERRLTDQLLQQEKLAAIGQLVSGVAHELNNPLAGVMAFSQLLLASPGVNADTLAGLETIHQESKRAAKIVKNLLTFARQHPPERRMTSLNEVLLDTLELRRYALRVQQIDVAVALDDALPGTWADGFQLQQVFLNLLANAEQAMADQPGEKCMTLRSWREGERLFVAVADTGPGIAPENADRVFNPFFTTKPVGQGTGLGLSISDGIVRQHGGRIVVRSTPGAGAEFVVELPLTAAGEEAPRAASATPPAPGTVRSVLIVDDEPSIRGALSGFLDSLGHAPDAVGTGGEALERMRARRYDAVLLDLRMPDMSGAAVYEAMKAADPGQAARVVFVTGDVQSDAARAFIRATGRPCLSKPFLLDDVAQVLTQGWSV